MTGIISIPSIQLFSDTGAVLAGGLVYSYSPNTLVNKATYSDIACTIVQSNPIVANAGGRITAFGSGLYRWIIKDAVGNLIYDLNTMASLPDNSISDVMGPVCSASSLSSARTYMGIDDEISLAIAAAVMVTGPASTTPGPTGPTGPQGDPGSSTAAYAPTMGSGYFQFPNMNGTAANGYFQSGQSATDSGGTISVSFPTPFPTSCTSVVATNSDGATGSWFISVTNVTTSGFTVTTSSPLHGGGWQGGPIGFFWMSQGN
jgi:hypothetical protein